MAHTRLLYLIRHGKASWSDPSLDDFDRPLKRRGLRDSLRMGRYLAQERNPPELILSSPALRAFSTARSLREAAGLGVDEVVTDGRIYSAEMLDLLQVIREISATTHTAYLIGHNPALQELAMSLTRHHLEKFRTCGMAELLLEVSCWREVTLGCGQLLRYVDPKLLQEG